MCYSIPGLFFFPWDVSKDFSEARLPPCYWFFSDQHCLLALLGRTRGKGELFNSLIKEHPEPLSWYWAECHHLLLAISSWGGKEEADPGIQLGFLRRPYPPNCRGKTLFIMQASAMGPSPRIAATLSSGHGYSLLGLLGSPQWVVTIVICREPYNSPSTVSLFHFIIIISQ